MNKWENRAYDFFQLINAYEIKKKRFTEEVNEKTEFLRLWGKKEKNIIR